MARSTALFADAILALLPPQQLAALREVLRNERGLPLENRHARLLRNEAYALREFFKERDERLVIVGKPVREALRQALGARTRPRTVEEALRRHIQDGTTAQAVSVFERSGGAFHAMIHGLESARACVALFPESVRQRELTLLLADAVNAMKSGNIQHVDFLTGKFPALTQLAEQEPLRACFAFVRAIYEDAPIGSAEMEHLFQVLARLPGDAFVERGLLYNVALDVFLRRREWATADETALRALEQFERSPSTALTFYIHLYRAIIDLAVGRIASASVRLNDAAEAVEHFKAATDNDRLLLLSLRFIQRYEAGEPEPWLKHLLSDVDPVPQGEIWPSIAEPILAYGRRALSTHATHAAALSWVRRWRVQQWRSQRLGAVIELQEVRALQEARRWQEADEVMSRHALNTEPDWMLVRLASTFDRAPGSPVLARALHDFSRVQNLSIRQQCRALVLRASAAKARRATAEAVSALSDLVQRAPPNEMPQVYAENEGPLSRLLTHRDLSPLLRKTPRLSRLLREHGSTRGNRSVQANMTPQQQRILHLVLEGLPNKVIAARLGIALATVKFHVGHILDKLGCRNRREIAQKAEQV